MLVKDQTGDSSFPPASYYLHTPCSTFSRARHSGRPGPVPIRSFEFPKGFPWLSNQHRQQAEAGNRFVDVMWELAVFAQQTKAHFLGERPEDLGLAQKRRPASIWQDQRFQDLLQQPGFGTFALFQCMFGAATSKPTRFVTDLQHWSSQMFWGPPQFQKDVYTGPLPTSCPHGKHDAQLIGLGSDGNWKTSPAAHYPGQLCEAIAVAILKTSGPPSAAAGGESSLEGGRGGIKRKSPRVEPGGNCEPPQQMVLAPAKQFPGRRDTGVSAVLLACSFADYGYVGRP